MKELTLTQKLLIGIGAAAVVAGACAGAVYLYKKKKQQDETLALTFEEEFDKAVDEALPTYEETETV